MAMTANDLLSHFEHRLGGPIAQLDAMALVNQAGGWITDCHPWKFLGRAPLSIPIGGGTVDGLLPLPADFKSLEGTPCGNINGRAIYPTTAQSFMDAKERGDTFGNSYLGCIFSDPSVAIGGGPPVWKLGLYPAPPIASTDVATIYYRAKWTVLVDDEDLSNTPDSFDALLIQAIRAYAQGIQTDTMDEQLARVRSSVLFADTAANDGSTQRRLGRIRGSGVRHKYGPDGNVAATINYTFP